MTVVITKRSVSLHELKSGSWGSRRSLIDFVHHKFQLLRRFTFPGENRGGRCAAGQTTTNDGLPYGSLVQDRQLPDLG